MALRAVPLVRLQPAQGLDRADLPWPASACFLLLMFLWFLAALVFRWRFQFSILSLLVLVVVVAIPFSWLATEMKAARKQGTVVDGIKKAGGHVAYDYANRSVWQSDARCDSHRATRGCEAAGRRPVHERDAGRILTIQKSATPGWNTSRDCPNSSR